MRSRCSLALLTSWLLAGCDERCPEGQFYDFTTARCTPVEDPPPPPPPPPPIDCAQVPKPACVATMEAQFYGNAAICVPTACEPPCMLELGICRVPLEDCPIGYVRDGNVCLVDDAISCYDAPQLDHCVPPLCSEHEVAA